MERILYQAESETQRQHGAGIAIARTRAKVVLFSLQRRRPVAKLRGVNKGGLTYSVIGARFALAAGGNGAEEIAVPTSG